MHWLVFTDLDGTLLDADTYSFAEAKDAVSFLKDRRIPLIPCTSKTHTEVIVLRNQLRINDPFITENGSAIFFENGYFADSGLDTITLNGFRVVVLGKKYEDILDFLKELKEKYGISARGFHEMDNSEIAERTGLSKTDAFMARERRFSEPFILLQNDEDKLNSLKPLIEKKGFRLLRGNRFFHLLGQSDKGVALRRLTALYHKYRRGKKFKTVAIGDSLNDLDMLQAADVAVLVKKKNGDYQQDINLPGLIYSVKAGPSGFSDAVFSIISGK